ncbi:hypothetical protein E3N88_09623 [Mikania micrantha]|uniref:Ubiquitin-like protease family profile domain-containing protein n=1 Tax=Mikania micrantha TaxID=192012 RepID=A0A5N6PKG6_9ASTR|nr:hypothetical protein E3N88_09623 [Mikania micrantha]
MGFGGLLSLQVEGVPQRMGFYVVDMFDEVNMEIRVPCENIKVDEESLHNLLGVPKDGVDLLSRDAKKVRTPGVTGWRKKYDKDYITPSDIDYFSDDTDVGKINWWKYIISRLKDCKKGWERKATSPFKGGLTILTDLDRLKGREHVEVASGCFGDGEIMKMAKLEWSTENQENIEGSKVTFDDICFEQLKGIQRMLTNSFEEKRETEKRIQFLYKKNKVDARLEVICSSYEEIYNSKPGLTDDDHGEGAGHNVEMKGYDTGEGVEDDVRIDAISLNGDETVEILLDQKEANFFDCKGDPADVTAKAFDLKGDETIEVLVEQKDLTISNAKESSGARTFEGNPLKVDLELTNENNQPIWDKTPCTVAKKQMLKKVTFLDKDDVCISMIYTKEEEAVWRYLFKNEIMPYIFETEDGLLAESRMLKTLSVGTQIAADVIDCWVAVLNNEERMAGNEQAKRLFCGPFVFKEWMLKQKRVDPSIRLAAFEKCIYQAIGRVEKLKNLKQYEVIIFPLIEMNHFYIIVQDLKNPGFYLIDNMDPDETVVSIIDHNDYYKKDTPYKVKHIIVDYLFKWKHPMKKELERATIVSLGLPWATIGNITNCGVFVMRHMEMFRSNCHKAFNCGF